MNANAAMLSPGAADLKKLIREVPDFPKPGINFYDITTMLKDRAGLKAVVDLLRERFRQAGAGALSDYELLEMVLFRALPRRDVKPLAKTDRCENQHVGYVVQGRLKVVGRDGSEGEINAGDAFVIPPGHDAWTVGNETVILLDFKGSPAGAKPK